MHTSPMVSPDGQPLYATKNPTIGGHRLIGSNKRGIHAWTLDGRRFISRHRQWVLHPLSKGEISPKVAVDLASEDLAVGRGVQ